MKSKRTSIVRLMRAPVLLACTVIALQGKGAAEPKRDVSDPVLQEVVAQFGPRMPRFVDKHGKEIFVADEAITRGSLLGALYEYDKSLRLSRKEFVTRQEFDELVNRQGAAASRTTASGSGVPAKFDVMQVINDLQPNMPVLLDNSLNDSKVFNGLREQVFERTSVPAEIKNDVEATRRELRELAARLDQAEAAPSASGARPARDIISKRDFEEMRAKLAVIERSVSGIGSQAAAPAAVPEDLKRSVGQLDEEMGEVIERMDRLEGALSAKGSGGQDLADVRGRLAVIERNISSAGRASYGDEEKASTGRVQNELRELSTRLAALEKKSRMPSSSEGAGSAGVERDLERARRDLARLEKRMDEVERTRYAETGSTGAEGGSRYGSALTKISLGLSMMAALFIAR